MRKLLRALDANGADTGLTPPSDTVNKKQLAANTAERDTIPTGARAVIISSTASIYVLCGDSTVTAAIGTDVTDGTASELNRSGFDLRVSGVTHISVISASACDVTFSYYSL